MKSQKGAMATRRLSIRAKAKPFCLIWGIWCSRSEPPDCLHNRAHEQIVIFVQDTGVRVAVCSQG